MASSDYYQRNKEKLKEKQRQYYWANRDDQRPKRQLSSILRYRRLRQELFDVLGRKCVQCGFDNELALQFDHIDGGGRKHRLGFNNYCQYYQALLKAPEQVQVLCANCNTIKMYEKSEHPKKEIIS